MTRQNGPWRIEGSERKYHNNFIDVVEDRVVQPDGQPGTYATVTTRRGVAVLPVDEAGQAHLVRQFRYAAGRESLEAASGSLDEGEDDEAAARRELAEELGMQAREWADLGLVELDTSIVRGPVRLFLARGLEFGEPHREGTETVRRVSLPLVEAVEQVMDSRITHGPSCVIILKAERYLSARSRRST